MGRSGKRTGMRGVERRGRQPRLAADDFVYSLHRRPVRWDLLVYRLAGALSTAYWRMRTSLSPGGCRFDSDDLPAVGLMLAKGFEVVLRRILRDEPEGDLARLIDAGTFGAPQAEQLAARVAGEAFEPLLRKYAEDVYDVLLPRPDNDLSRVVRVMSEALAGLLTRAADPADKLAATLTDPLAAASPDLPDNLQPRDPAPAGASRARDILLLAPTIHASDDAGEAKRKLVHFTHNDPWLFAEASNYVLDRTEDNGADEEDDWDVDPGVARFGALDDFLYRATRVGGRTPIELFVERQPDPEAPQCRRMLRWSDEAFAGLFQVKRVSLPRLWLKDLEDDREYEVFSTRPKALRPLRERELLFTRLAPWDEWWVMSGVQQKWGMPNAEDLDAIRKKLKFAPPHRPTNPDDPAVRKAMEIQAEQHAAWVEFFGADELVFAGGREMQDAVNRFMRHWSQELRDPATGMTRAERYEQEYKRPAPEANIRLPDELLRATGTGIVFDRLHGMILLANYARIRDLFDSGAPPTAADAAMVLEYLRDPSVDPVVLRRLCDRHPARARELIRSALRDQEFELGRDLESLLRSYNGVHMRGAPRPGVTLVEQKQPLTR